MSDDHTSDQESPETVTSGAIPANTADDESKGSALRIWPAIGLLAMLWAIKLILPQLPTTIPVMMAWFLGPLVCGGAIVLWWLLASRASWREKIWLFFGLLAILGVTVALAEQTMKTAGTMFFIVPWGITGFAVSLIALSRVRPPRRTWITLLVTALSFGVWDLVRLDKMWGDFSMSLSWRWEPTSEDEFLAELAARPRSGSRALPVGDESLSEPEWPGFRGPQRNGIQPGVVLGEDWESQPPREVWRSRIGPGWSSFSVAGNRLFTQEQRGEAELVVCYDADQGTEIWVHEDTTRFWEVVGGAGPRATPTLADGTLFALGATGLLSRLDPLTGELLWQTDIGEDAGREPPTWGYSSSPLVVDQAVIVHAGGPDGRGLLAYDFENGERLWSAPAETEHSYSSPQLAEIDGRVSVLMLTKEGLTVVDPAGGAVQCFYEWKYEGYRVVQPNVIENSSVLLGTARGSGTRRIELSWNDDRLVAEETWTSRGMNPDFNDSVAHDGYLYGFDNNIFACMDITTGEQQWRRGRYGSGQVLLLPDGNQLLVLSEQGELVLLRATPEELTELARHPVLDGRTWNHPVVIGNRVYVRNGEEAACFELPIVESAITGVRGLAPL